MRLMALIPVKDYTDQLQQIGKIKPVEYDINIEFGGCQIYQIPYFLE